MFTRFVRPICLVLLVLCSFETTACAAPLETPPLDPTSASVRQQLMARKPGADVKLVCSDGSVVRGRIVAVRAESVELKSKKSSSTISLADVRSVDKAGLSRGAKIGIGVGAGVLGAAGVFAIVVVHELNKPIFISVPNY